MSNYGCQQVLISPNEQLKSVLEFICEESNKLANCGIYYSRQLYLRLARFLVPKRAGEYQLAAAFKSCGSNSMPRLQRLAYEHSQ